MQLCTKPTILKPLFFRVGVSAVLLFNLVSRWHCSWCEHRTAVNNMPLYTVCAECMHISWWDLWWMHVWVHTILHRRCSWGIKEIDITAADALVIDITGASTALMLILWNHAAKVFICPNSFAVYTGCIIYSVKQLHVSVSLITTN